LALTAQHLKPARSDRLTEPTQNSLLQRLVDEGTVYVPQSLSPPQFATLHALLSRIIPQLGPQLGKDSSNVAAGVDADLANGSSASNAPRARAFPIGLDELDSIARIRAGYAFAKLTPELQDAILSLISTGDITTSKLNLALWLEDIRSSAAANPVLTAQH
jgi:Gluconate 2-dehydrogenase subunit 3